MTDLSRSAIRTTAAALVAGLALAGCSSGSTSHPRPTQLSGASTTLAVSPKALTAPKVVAARDLGLTVAGQFGRRPNVKPPTGAAPTELTVQVLESGTGAKVILGQVLIADYQVQTWGSSKTKPVVVDDSFTRGTPIAAIVGAGQVVKNWDGALIGQKVGSRVLVVLPAGSAGPGVAATSRTGPPPAGPAAGQPMLVVVDILATLPKDTAANGAKVSVKAVAGLPTISSEPGKQPEVTSVSGIKQTIATSQLLLKGNGAAITPGHTLVVQMIQVDAATSRMVNQTWGGTPLLMRSDQLLPTVPALTGSRVGSRALAVIPASGQGHAQVLVVDLISQL
jgi:hypothetical protein